MLGFSSSRQSGEGTEGGKTFSEDLPLKGEATFDHHNEMIELIQGSDGMKSCFAGGSRSWRCVVLRT